MRPRISTIRWLRMLRFNLSAEGNNIADRLVYKSNLPVKTDANQIPSSSILLIE